VLPRLVTDQLVDGFCSGLEAAAATWETLVERSALPDRVFAYYVREGLSGGTAIAPALAEFAWPSALRPEFGTTDGRASLGVSRALAGVAETGSLALASGPDTPTGLNFLPEFHIVVLARHQLVAHLEDAWAAVGWPRPRAINLITGPSRTADVEQTLQLGAHGPRQLHVILLPDGTMGRS
jgi:L-lactate utilization protein LutB